jgi:histidinol-phosphate/aromatic aminotransferase/cobyric acid decarboxylase-like protein
MLSPLAVEQVSTITLGATGIADAIGSVYAVQSQLPFKNLSITVRPYGPASPYKVEIYHDEELEESHDYPDPAGRTICDMYFKSYMFPANQNTKNIPKFNGREFKGIPIKVVIYNYSSEIKVFEVYAVYEAYEHCRFGIVKQDT